MEIREEKREIRKKILALRDGMGSDERKRASLLLTERIAGINGSTDQIISCVS